MTFTDDDFGYMAASLRDPGQVDDDGIATIEYPGMLTGRITMGYPTPARRRARRSMGRADQLRRQRRSKVDANRTKYILSRIERDRFAREVEEALEQLVAEGAILKNPDGTYQAKPPTLAQTLHDRRNRLRGES